MKVFEFSSCDRRLSRINRPWVSRPRSDRPWREGAIEPNVKVIALQMAVTKRVGSYDDDVACCISRRARQIELSLRRAYGAGEEGEPGVRIAYDGKVEVKVEIGDGERPVRGKAALART